MKHYQIMLYSKQPIAKKKETKKEELKKKQVHLVK